ncbi:MAG: hypothetical protein ABIH41_02780, partial [Nanoarchaeota archaeon]
MNKTSFLIVVLLLACVSVVAAFHIEGNGYIISGIEQGQTQKITSASNIISIIATPCQCIDPAGGHDCTVPSAKMVCLWDTEIPMGFMDGDSSEQACAAVNGVESSSGIWAEDISQNRCCGDDILPFNGNFRMLTAVEEVGEPTNEINADYKLRSAVQGWGYDVDGTPETITTGSFGNAVTLKSTAGLSARKLYSKDFYLPAGQYDLFYDYKASGLAGGDYRLAISVDRSGLVVLVPNDLPGGVWTSDGIWHRGNHATFSIRTEHAGKALQIRLAHSASSGEISFDNIYIVYPGSDLGYVDAEGKYLCAQDLGSDGRITTNDGTPHWWVSDIASIDGSYIVHSLPPYTPPKTIYGEGLDVVSNTESFFACDVNSVEYLRSPSQTPKTKHELLPVPDRMKTDSSTYLAVDYCEATSYPPPSSGNPFEINDADRDTIPDIDEVAGHPECIPTTTMTLEEWVYIVDNCDICKQNAPASGVPGGQSDINKTDCTNKVGQNCLGTGGTAQNETAVSCSGDIDNDRDGRKGCTDPDCLKYIQTSCPIGSMEICTDERDNDGDDLVDCSDPDCILASSECSEPEPDPVLANAGLPNSFACDNFGSASVWAECCANGKCENGIARTEFLNPLNGYNLFATSNSIDTIISTETVITKDERKFIADTVRKGTFQTNEISFTQPVLDGLAWTPEFGFLEFDIMFTKGGTFRFVLEAMNGSITEFINPLAYSTNGWVKYRWHHVVLPLDRIQRGTAMKAKLTIVCAGGNCIGDSVVIDNVFLVSPRQDSLYFCAAEHKTWIKSLSLQTYDYPLTKIPPTSSHALYNTYNAIWAVCDATMSYKWTGSRCCGYESDSRRSNTLEYYSDASYAGCWAGFGVENNQLVNDSLNMNTLGQNYSSWKYYNGKFLGCGNGLTAPDANPGWMGFDKEMLTFTTVPNAAGDHRCDRAGIHFCNASGEWLSIEDEGQPFRLEDGNMYGCVAGELVPLSYDWWQNDKTTRLCAPNECNCPMGPDSLVGAYKDLTCPTEMPVDGQCAPNGTYVEDHFCNAGKWTTRTALLALAMRDRYKQSTDMSIYCDEPAAGLVNGE